MLNTVLKLVTLLIISWLIVTDINFKQIPIAAPGEWFDSRRVGFIRLPAVR
jgi:hypothetical protein